MAVSVVSPHISSVGEGPHWEPKTGTLYYVDFPAGQIHRFDPKTKESVKLAKLDGRVNFIIPYDSDPETLIIGHETQLEKLDVTTSKVETIVNVEHAYISDTAINDAKCDVTGRVWFGTISSNLDLKNLFPEERASLYSYGTKLQHHLGSIGISNGIGWTGDNRTLFFADSFPARSVYAFDFDLEGGVIKNQRTVVNYKTTPGFKDYGNPDGLTVDIEDKVWVACFGGGHVLRIDPERGTIIDKVKIPARDVTSCCFGGANYDELYVTTASMVLSPEELRNQPHAGAVFKVSNMPVKGRPAYTYRE